MLTTLILTYEHKDHPKGELTITGEEEYMARVLQVSMHDMLWAMGVREADGKFNFHLDNDECTLSASVRIKNSFLPMWLGDVIKEAYEKAQSEGTTTQPMAN